jgi:hypothetical protein
MLTGLIRGGDMQQNTAEVSERLREAGCTGTAAVVTAQRGGCNVSVRHLNFDPVRPRLRQGPDVIRQP